MLLFYIVARHLKSFKKKKNINVYSDKIFTYHCSGGSQIKRTTLMQFWI